MIYFVSIEFLFCLDRIICLDRIFLFYFYLWGNYFNKNVLTYLQSKLLFQENFHNHYGWFVTVHLHLFRNEVHKCSYMLAYMPCCILFITLPTILSAICFDLADPISRLMKNSIPQNQVIWHVIAVIYKRT